MIVLASTRPGRVGETVASWIHDLAERHGGFEVDLVDLRELDLPMMNEPHHPRLQQYQHDHTKAWSARVQATDAFIAVTPEYNGTFTAPLKNAIDYLCREWHRKPLGIVSYGGVSAGTRAAANLRQVVATVGMVTTMANVAVSMVREHLGPDGAFTPPPSIAKSAAAMLDELISLDGALSTLR